MVAKQMRTINSIALMNRCYAVIEPLPVLHFVSPLERFTALSMHKVTVLDLGYFNLAWFTMKVFVFS